MDKHAKCLGETLRSTTAPHLKHGREVGPFQSKACTHDNREGKWGSLWNTKAPTPALLLAGMPAHSQLPPCFPVSCPLWGRQFAKFACTRHAQHNTHTRHPGRQQGRGLAPSSRSMFLCPGGNEWQLFSSVGERVWKLGHS